MIDTKEGSQREPKIPDDSFGNGNARMGADVVILDAYKQMLFCLFVATACIIFVLAAILVLLPHLSNQGSDEPSIFTAVALSGSLGAFFSALMRLYSFEDLPKALLVRTKAQMTNWHLLIYSLIPPLVGSIAAAALYVAFAADIIGGSLFPNFECHLGEDKCPSFDSFMWKYGPNQAQDYAKALIWGFIAGFSERFVPDRLLRIQENAAADTQVGATGT